MFEQVSGRDLFDILAVAFILYNLLLLIRGTRAVQMLIGLVFVGGFYYLARVARLTTLEQILESLLIFLPFAIIVLFQHEIRRALTSFGRSPLWGRSHYQTAENTFNEVIVAATTLSSRRTGALIVLERFDGLRNYIENGIHLDAAVSYDLLINLFVPDTPLHDGAVIIQNDRIAAAAAFLPLTNNPEVSKEFGTRHRAALGISEETDAVAVVVSEETGIISLAIDGQMHRNLDARSLQRGLYQAMMAESGFEPLDNQRDGQDGRGEVSGGREAGGEAA